MSKLLVEATSAVPSTCSSSFTASASTSVEFTALFAFESRDFPIVLLANSFNPIIAAS